MQVYIFKNKNNFQNISQNEPIFIDNKSYSLISNTKNDSQNLPKDSLFINFDLLWIIKPGLLTECEFAIEGDFDSRVVEYLKNSTFCTTIKIFSQNVVLQNDLTNNLAQQDSGILTYNYTNCFVTKHELLSSSSKITIVCSPLYNDSVVDYISKTCSLSFCDSKCGLNIQNYTQNGTVSELQSNESFKDYSLSDSKSFYLGSIKFTSGKNIGLTYGVKNVNNFTISLLQYLKYDLSVGDTYQITQSCDKTYQTCKGFNNQLNFRGF